MRFQFTSNSIDISNKAIQGCLIMPDFQRRFGQIGSDGQPFLTSSQQSIITSLLSAGYVPYSTCADIAYRLRSTFVGALGQAFTSDRFGRKGSILIWSAIFTVGTAIQTATATSLAQITIGRFIAGLGVGALSGTYSVSRSPIHG